jgi:hypothetical protein
MNYWLIIHSLKAFDQHPDLIGTEEKLSKKITGVCKGDKIVYYATGDSVIVGTFDVIGKKQHVEDDDSWQGPHVCMKIKARKLASRPLFIKIHDFIANMAPPLSLFPDRKFVPVKLKDKTAVKITEKDFKAIEKFIKTYKPAEQLFKGLANDENLGEPMDLEVMNYAPTSEQGVVALFSHFMRRIKNHQFVKIEFIRLGFPDACAIEKEGNTYSRKYIEFEFKASKFKEHIKKSSHRNIKCDYVVCWENDFQTCPIKVIELKKDVKDVPAKGEKLLVR